MSDTGELSDKLPSLHLFSATGPSQGEYCDLEFIAKNRRLRSEAQEHRSLPIRFSAAADMHSLRERIMAMANKSRSHIVMFNSPERATTSAELILEFAWERSKYDNDKILIIDCNLRAPVLSRVYNLASGVGLAEYLAGTHTLQEVVKRTNLHNVHLLRRGCLRLDPLQLLMSPRLCELRDGASRQFDFILLNSPPYRHCIDSFLLAKFVRPLVVLAVDSNGAGWNATADIRADLQRYDLNVLGLINHS